MFTVQERAFDPLLSKMKNRTITTLSIQYKTNLAIIRVTKRLQFKDIVLIELLYINSSFIHISFVCNIYVCNTCML